MPENKKISLLEEIFFNWLVKSIPDIWASISTQLIRDKSRKIKEVPSLRSWLKCYRNSHKIFHLALVKLISSVDNTPIFTEQLKIHLSSKIEKNELYQNVQNEIQTMSAEEIDMLNSEIELNKQNLKKECDALLNEKYSNISQKESFDLVSTQEIQFFMRIIIPCLVIHGKFHSTMLRKARLGDENIIKWMARLDNSILKDSKIAQYIHKLSFNNPTRHKIFCRSLTEESSTLDIGEIKVSIATLISRVNFLFHKVCGSKRLNSEEIRYLFTQEARMHGLEDDFDLPASKEALYKRIKRNTIWDEIIKLPDKN